MASPTINWHPMNHGIRDGHVATRL